MENTLLAFQEAWLSTYSPLYSNNAPNLNHEQGFEEQAMSAGCEHLLYTHDRDKGGNRSAPPALPPEPARSPSAYRLPDGSRA
jgi:hypothetical protein